MADRKQTKQQLLAEVATLRHHLAALQTARIEAERIVETVREPLLVLTADLHIISANAAFYHTFHVTPEETEHQLLYELGTGQWDIPALRRLLEEVLPTDAPVRDFEVRHTFPTIGQKVMLLNARRIPHDGSAPRILLAIEDITERWRAARLLQQRSEWFTVTLTSIGDAVIATDTQAVVTFMNPEAERLTGWPSQEALGRDITEVLILCSEETRQVVENPVLRVLRTGIVAGLGNHTLLLSRDGREIPIADSGAPIRGTDGTLHGVVMVFRDITERAVLEGNLLRAKDAAEAANRAKSEFLATMSHELRTPLSVIIGYTELMLEGTFGAVTAGESRILQRVRENAVELLDLITAMLDVSRLEAGRLPVHVQEEWLPALIEEVKTETQEVWERTQLALVIQAADSFPPLYTDPAKLKVVLKNLLRNAVKFTPQGSITVQWQSWEGGVAIQVTDTGIGIPADALTLIFEPFRQVETEGRGTQHGTGLGLYITKRLVELLGGTVEVESAVGKGSTFRVWVPVGSAPT